MQANQSSSSEEIPGSVMDQKKRKRMLSNRESARKSRMRKQQHLDELINQAAHLKNENSQIEMQADLLNQQFLIMDSENCALRSEVMELTERLRSMNSILEFVGEFSGMMMMDIQEIPDPLLKPWQFPFPCPTQPVMFQY